MNAAQQERVVITGITGFAGSHLAEYCLHAGLRVYGLTRPGCELDNLGDLQSEVALSETDLGDVGAIMRILEGVRPQQIFHLAAQTPFQSQGGVLLHTNILGTFNLLEACRRLPSAPRVLIASSSAVYGRVEPSCEPITEATLLNPIDAYGLSKATQDRLAERFFVNHGLPVVITRAFNHTGPRERHTFVCSTVAKQIAEIEQGNLPPTLSVGNLETRRDFSDVRDIVRGYSLALTRGRIGEVYNLASGHATAVGAILQHLLALSGVKVEVVQEPSRLRVADVPCQVGDYTKASRELGWRPEIPLDHSLRDLLDYWRERVARAE
jgi:GDP-4-dehydro-6-deoxy-D-mannose reductase